MTDQSRVEAVARAMDAYLWSEIDKPDAERHYIAPYYDATEIHSARSGSLHKAQQAIEANDAWLKARGWEPGQKGYSRYAMFAGIHLNSEEVDR